MNRKCKDCGKDFELSQGEINFYKSKNLNLPKRCKECRDKNKDDSNGNRSGKNRNILSDKKNPIIGVAIAIFAVLFILFTEEDIPNQSSQNINQQIEIDHEFRSDDLLTSHFEKHGGEFDYNNKEEYLAGANAVIDSNEALHKTEAEDGDEIFYLPDTNEIVFMSKDGYIRSYFRPDDGMDYYNRQ